MRIGLVSGSHAVIALVRESIAAALPTASFSDAGPDATATLAECSLIFIDATADAVAAGETAQRVRASASRSALAFVVTARDDALAKKGAAAGAIEQIEMRALGPTMAGTDERADGGARVDGEGPHGRSAHLAARSLTQQRERLRVWLRERGRRA